MLLRVVLELTFVPIVFLTALAVMAAVDDSTPWRIGTWSGPGASGDFYKVAGLTLVGWTLLALGWRGAKSAFKVLIVLWHFGLTAVALVPLLQDGDFALRGDALGFRVSIGLLGPLLSLTALVCALVWITGDRRRDARARSVSPLQRRNKLAAAAAVLGFVAAGSAFALAMQEVGTIACLAACCALHETIRPLNPSAELHKALVGEGSAPE